MAKSDLFYKNRKKL